MSEQQANYRQVLKATSLFGGVQFINVIISIIRTKFIAVLIGPAGMGIAGLLSSTTMLIGGITNFGLGISAVKDISAAHVTNDQKRIALILTVFRWLVWITGILGTLITLIFSPLISNITFGNRNYTLAFIWISITLLFGQLSSGQLAVLQGMRKLRDLANASVLGSFLGLAVTLPLYYFYGIDGIVPAIILTSIASLLISWYFGRKVKTETIKVTRKIMFAEGKSMLIIGSVISVNGILALVTSYVMRIYINSRGGIADVGLYNAGFAIVNSYVGMIFTAMLTDYYPKLSSVVNDTKLFNQTINQQADIALLLIAPIISIFLVFIQIGVTVLLSTKFLAVEGMLIWAMLGVFFKTASWPIGFIFIPKGDSKLFFFSELAGNIYTFIFNIAGYYYWGLEGLGISFLIGYLIYYLQVSTIARLKYHFSFEPAFYRIFIVQFSLAVICFIIEKYLSIPYLKYPIGLLLIGISIWHSIKELNKRLNIKTLMASVKMKYGISFNSNDKRSDKTD